MSLTRKMLKSMSLTEEQIDSIIDEHSATVSALKEERDNYKADAEKYKEAQKALEEANKQLEANSEKAEELEKLRKEYDEYKKNTEEKESKLAKQEARAKLLKDAGIPEKWTDRASKSINLDEISIDKNGDIKNADELVGKIKEEWADVIGDTKTKGADVSNPPSNNGKTTMSKEDIMKIKDTSERQKAIAENHELFGF